jgi:type IV pilus assembly protein PilB
MRRIQLGDLLVSQRLITAEQLDRALETQRRSHAPIGTILVRMGVIDEWKLLQALATQMGVPAWDLRRDNPDTKALDKVDIELCERYAVLPVALRGDLLTLGMRNPADTDAIELVRNTTNLRVEPVLVDEARLYNQLRVLHGQRGKSAGSDVDTLVKQAIAEYGVENDRRVRQERTVISESDTRPVVGMVNQIIGDAIRLHASDIHLEPRFDKMEVRYRIDGMLVKLREIPDGLIPMLTARLKIMSGMDIVEQRQPQDGRMTVELDGQSVDVRISVLPNVHGPRIVMRVLDRAVGLKSLEHLGFTAQNESLFRQLVQRPYGLFLVTGPTGSGKTTTLYAAIQELRDNARNIMTCEDPVEYDVEGINQAQVQEGLGQTFAKQLRAILRQDPDIILVGEIRDKETAETAIRAAMTGHLVLSTLHCNDAASAVPRLLDLGVDPFLLSSSLIGVTAQRLLRKLCPDCRELSSTTAEEEVLMRTYFGVDGIDEVWRSAGCEACFHTGYHSRTAVHEVLPVTSDVASLIAKGATVEEIRLAGVDYGYRTLQEDALERVLAGETTLEEAKRLIAFEKLLRPQDILQIAA